MECSIDGCNLPVFVKLRGWCRKHYHRWHRTGDPLQASFDRVDGTDEYRWFAHVEKTKSCWLWTGSLDRNGYGVFTARVGGRRKAYRAHRWGYELLVRPLDGPEETIDHLCRVHRCVNPDHLDPVSHAENVARGLAGYRNAVKTHCPQGHEYDVQVNEQGWRACRVCMRTASKASARRIRGTADDAVPNGEKTHCKRGHEFTEENTQRPRRGGRVCRECTRVRRAEQKAASPG